MQNIITNFIKFNILFWSYKLSKKWGPLQILRPLEFAIEGAKRREVQRAAEQVQAQEAELAEARTRAAEKIAGQKSVEAIEMEKNRLAQVRDKVVSLGMNQDPAIMPLLTAIDHEIYNPADINGYLYNIGNIAYYTALQGANLPIAEDKMQKAKDSAELFVVNVLNPLDVAVKKLEEQAVAQAQANAIKEAVVQNKIVQEIVDAAQPEKTVADTQSIAEGAEEVATGDAQTAQDVQAQVETGVETQGPLEGRQEGEETATDV